MRLCLDFNLKKAEMVKDYRRCIVSWIKKALSIVHEGKYFNEYYNDTVKKPFTFTVLFNKPVFEKDNIVLDNNNFKVYFSTINEKNTGLILCNALLKMKNKKFKLPNDNIMWLVNVKKLNEHIFTENRVTFKTVGGSCIIVREHDRKTNKDKYYTCEDDKYIEKLQEKIKYQLITEGYSSDKVNEVTVNNVSGKKIVIKNYGIYLDGTKGIFDISAPPDILQKLYLEGMVGKRSMGFGFIDIYT